MPVTVTVTPIYKDDDKYFNMDNSEVNPQPTEPINANTYNVVPKPEPKKVLESEGGGRRRRSSKKAKKAKKAKKSKKSRKAKKSRKH